MPGRVTTFRLFVPIAITSVLLLSLCGFTAVFLYRLQSSTVEELGENVDSRRAAFDLELNLDELATYPPGASDATDRLNESIVERIAAVRQLADKPGEIALADRIQAGYTAYCAAMDRVPSGAGADHEAFRAALAILKQEAIVPCYDLRVFNAHQIEISEDATRQSMRWMALGLMLVGVIGSAGGLFMGFGVARWLRQSIHKLQVRVQDAADKLGQDLPSVVVTGGDFDQLHEQVQSVILQIEQVVQKLQQREREVLRADQLSAVGQLAAGVAHEIRNPLTSIKLLIDMVREEAEAHGLPVDDFVVIRNEIRRMERSLNSLLDFARPPRPEKAPQELAGLVEQTLSLVQGRAAKQNVAIEFVKPPQSVVVNVDGGQLQQVFVNLALNSLDAMPNGGRLTVDLKALTNGQVELELSDTGPGIAPEMLPRLFEPFASNKVTGLGLGLVTSRRIVEDHGGSLIAGAQRQCGARFIIKLPARAG